MGDVLAAARAAYGSEFTEVLERARVWVNGDEPAAGEATRLRDGDEVAVIPPVSGGADAGITPAELEAAGLYDPADEHAEQRLELLRYLLELGATMEDLDGARDDLPFLATALSLRPGRERLTLAEVARRAGAPLDKATRIWRTSGLAAPGPDDRVYSEADVELVGIVLLGEELYGEEAILQLARVAAAAIARVVEAVRSAFLVHVAPRAAEDPSGLALARANAEAASLVPGLSHALDVLLRHHFESNYRHVEPLSGTTRGYDSQQLTVGFVDAVAEGGGRLVKLIGDEAMFVVADADTACDIAGALINAVASHPVLPPGRGGLAAGEVLTREGDYFGPVVNLAARAVKLAEPGGVLASPEVRSASEPHRFTSIGEQTLRGFDQPVELFRLGR